MNDKVKSLFFSQYWGQKILRVSDGAIVTQTVDQYFMENFPKTSYLLLIDISQLSDEEAISLAKIEFAVFQCTGFEFKVSRNTKEPIIVWVFRNNELVKKVELTVGFLHLDATDYLRSMGFLLPFTYLSENNQPITLTPAEIINLGWVKLQSNEQ